MLRSVEQGFCSNALGRFGPSHFDFLSPLFMPSAHHVRKLEITPAGGPIGGKEPEKLAEEEVFLNVKCTFQSVIVISAKRQYFDSNNQ